MIRTAENNRHFNKFSLLKKQVWVFLDEVAVDCWSPVKEWAAALSWVRTGHICRLQSRSIFRPKTTQFVDRASTASFVDIAFKLPFELGQFGLGGEEYRFANCSDEEAVITATTRED
jgi:hypothetical protein